LEKIARFKEHQSSKVVIQNDLAFLGRIGKASLSEFPEIYVLTNTIDALEYFLKQTADLYASILEEPL
jgi:hypothetical protein